MKRGTGALVRTLNPEIAGPFVEFKIRVENRYGSPCKQMCLDSKQRYRRCARRVVRLSAYQKFSDPILYFKVSTIRHQQRVQISEFNNGNECSMDGKRILPKEKVGLYFI